MPYATLLTSAALALLGSAGIASAHMEMQFPPPIRSKFNSFTPAGNADSDMTKPLGSMADYPCKQYHTQFAGKPEASSVATFAPGSAHNFTIVGGAFHNGGSCQASLSYDQGKTFTVIQSIQGACPGQGTSSFDFKVPEDAPNGAALFAWTWFNTVGNREMYMNCAMVTIGGAKKVRDVAQVEKRAAFTARPNVFVANLGNGCKTSESSDLVFPDPGPDLKVNANGPTKGPEGSCGSTGSSSGGNTGSGSDSGSGTPTTSAAAGGNGGGATAAPTSTAVATTSSSVPGGVFVTVSTGPTSASASSQTTTLATSTKASGATSTNAGTNPTGTGTSGSGGSSSGGSSSGGSTAGSISAGTACAGDEGAWNCVGGSSFQRCASGMWSVVMPMAAGTSCQSGKGSTLVFAGRRRRGVPRTGLSAWEA